jgi:plasmid replication initiation protein
MARIIKKKKPLASLIVTQANELVESRYNLTLGEQRLIFTMISRIQPEDEDFKPYRISLSELAEFLGINKNHIYSDCKKITKKLLEKVVEIQEPRRLLQTHWVSSADYVDGTGVVNLTFDPLLKPYLLQLKGNFTSSKLDMLLSFKSQYTMRMYTLLKQYERLNGREIELQVLREILGIGKEQYKLHTDFKRNILESTQKELKAKADLTFEFEELKLGRKVGAIRFRIISKKLLGATSEQILVNTTLVIPEFPIPEAQISSLLAELLKFVPEQHKEKKTVQTALDGYGKKQGFDYVKRNVLYSNVKAAKSYAGFLNNALKEDWGHDWELEQHEVPVKKKVVEIWERQGFPNQKEYDDFMYRKQMEVYGQQHK